jgi:class 3 adenylate cyclase/streptogramin lyase
MASLPRGTVTFLFSDVEGSTRLQHTLGDRYQQVVETHRVILESAFAEHGGTVVDRQTESFFCAFPRAQAAVAAAAAAQRALAAQEWPGDATVRVRMGIHAGEPELAGDRYVGLAVSRAARICAAAHGGQVLLSSSARALLADEQRISLLGLGPHRLKDFPDPEPLFQLVLDGQPTRFPPLRTDRPRHRKRLLVAGVGLLLIGGILGGIAAVTSGGASGLSHIGPSSVGVIDAKTGKLLGEVPLGFKSGLIAAGEGYIWVADPVGSTLTKIDPKTMRKVATSSLGGLGTIPTGLAAGRGSVWVSALTGGRQRLSVLELEPELSTLRREIVLERSKNRKALGPVAIPLDVGPARVWVLEQYLARVRSIEPRTGRVSTGIEGLDAVSIAVGSGGVWVGGRGSVTRIDPDTGEIVESIPIGGAVESQSTSIAAGAGAVWFAGSSRARLYRISPSQNAVTSTVSVGHGPSGIAVGEGAVWVANSRDRTVSEVKLDSGSPRTIRLGAPPGGIVTYRGRVWTSPGIPQS